MYLDFRNGTPTDPDAYYMIHGTRADSLVPKWEQAGE